MKTIRRNWLKKQIEAGKVEAKCNYHLTDDYAFDNAYNFQKTDWLPARVSHPTYRTVILQNGIEREIRDNDDFVDGAMNFHDYDFEMGTAHAYYNDDGEIRFCPLSSESYTLRIIS